MSPPSRIIVSTISGKNAVAGMLATTSRIGSTRREMCSLRPTHTASGSVQTSASAYAASSRRKLNNNASGTACISGDGVSSWLAELHMPLHQHESQTTISRTTSSDVAAPRALPLQNQTEEKNHRPNQRTQER